MACVLKPNDYVMQIFLLYDLILTPYLNCLESTTCNQINIVQISYGADLTSKIRFIYID
jgi:hypothetical protein